MQKVASKSKMTITTLLIAMILVLVAVVAVTTFGHDGGAVAQASAQVQTKTDSHQYNVVRSNYNAFSATSNANDMDSKPMMFGVWFKDDYYTSSDDYAYYFSVTGEYFGSGANSYVIISESSTFSPVISFGLFSKSNGDVCPGFSYIIGEDEFNLMFTEYSCGFDDSVILSYYDGVLSYYLSTSRHRLVTYDDYVTALSDAILLKEFSSSAILDKFFNRSAYALCTAGTARENIFALERLTDTIEPLIVPYDMANYLNTYQQSARAFDGRNLKFYDWYSNCFVENSCYTYIVELSVESSGQLDELYVWIGLLGGEDYSCSEHDYDYCSKFIRFGSRYSSEYGGGAIVEHYLEFGHNYYPDASTYEFSTIGDWDLSIGDNLYLTLSFDYDMSNIYVALSYVSAYYWGVHSYEYSQPLVELYTSDFDEHPEYGEFFEAFGNDCSPAYFRIYSFDNYDESDPFYYPEDYSISCNEHFYLYEKIVSYVPDLEVPEREGYNFTGWYYDEDCTQPYDGGEITTGQTLYPGWERITFTVFFDGSSLDSRYDSDNFGLYSTTVTVGYGDVAVWSGGQIDPSLAFLNFSGWYFEDGTKYENTPILSDTHLYAKAYCYVSFDINGGVDHFEPIYCEVGEPVTLPTPSERAFYDFVGWYFTRVQDGGYEAKYYVYGDFIPDKSTTLIADWQFTGRLVTFYLDAEYVTEFYVEDGTLLTSAVLTQEYSIDHLDYFVYQDEFYFNGSLDFDIAEFEIHDNIDIYLSSDVVSREPSGPTIADGDGENGEDKASGFAAKWTAFWNEVKAFFLRIRDWFIRVGQWFKNLFKRK